MLIESRAKKNVVSFSDSAALLAPLTQSLDPQLTDIAYMAVPFYCLTIFSSLNYRLSDPHGRAINPHPADLNKLRKRPRGVQWTPYLSQLAD